MGLYRFALAAVVVMFHFGDFPWPAGRMAVFGFYFISGFLITRVLDRHYLESPASLLRFYLNRAIRLMPLMAVIVLLSWLFIEWRAGRPFVPEHRDYLPESISTAKVLATLRLVFLPSLDTRVYDGYPFVAFQMPTDVIPQAWSIGVELVFYLVAPVLVLAGRWKTAALAALTALALLLFGWGMQSTHGDFTATENHIYKNAVSSMLFFACGALTCFLLGRRTGRLRYEIMAGIVLAWVIYLPLLSRMPPWSSSEPSNLPFITHLLAMVPLGVIVCLTQVPQALRRVDDFLGNLSYGIYLAHYLAAALVLVLGERWFIATGTPLFEEAGSRGFGVTTLAVSIGLAALGFFLVEQPCERWRSRVRGARVQPAARQSTAPLPASRGWGIGLALVPLLLLMAMSMAHAQYLAPAKRAEVTVRWRPALEDQARQAAESALALACAVKDDSAPDGRTYRYCLDDASSGHLRAIVEHPAIEDTGKIDRRNFTLQN